MPLEASRTEVALKSYEEVSAVSTDRGWWSYSIAKTLHFCSLLVKSIDDFLELGFVLINHFFPSDFQVGVNVCINPFTQMEINFFHNLGKACIVLIEFFDSFFDIASEQTA